MKVITHNIYAVLWIIIYAPNKVILLHTIELPKYHDCINTWNNNAPFYVIERLVLHVTTIQTSVCYKIADFDL